jgi:hypothetical protein
MLKKMKGKIEEKQAKFPKYGWVTYLKYFKEDK